MKRLLEYMRPYRWRVIIALALVAMVTPLELAPPALFGQAIDKYMVPGSDGTSLAERAWHGIVLVSADLPGCVLIFDFLAQYVQIRIMQRVGQQTMYDMRKEIFGRLQRLPMTYFDRNPVGRLMTRVTTDVDALNDLFAAGVVAMINDFFLLVVMAAVLFCIDARLALAAFAVLPFIFVVTLVFRKYVRDANRQIRTAIARINAFLQEYISGMSVVQLFNRERKAREEFRQTQQRQHAGVARRDSGLRRFLSRRGIPELRDHCPDLLGGRQFASCAERLTSGRSDRVHDVRAAVFPADSGLERKIQYSAVGDGGVRAHFQAAGRADHHRNERQCATTDFAARRNRIPQRVVQLHGTARNPATKTGCCATSLSALRRARRSRSSATPAPEKPRSFPLLLRFYDIQRGQILLDGVDIRLLDLQELRRQFGIVLQDPFLFTGTIESNVRLGTQELPAADVEQRCDEVGLGDYASIRCPQGVGRT